MSVKLTRVVLRYPKFVRVVARGSDVIATDDDELADVVQKDAVKLHEEIPLPPERCGWSSSERRRSLYFGVVVFQLRVQAKSEVRELCVVEVKRMR